MLLTANFASWQPLKGTKSLDNHNLPGGYSTAKQPLYRIVLLGALDSYVAANFS